MERTPKLPCLPGYNFNTAIGKKSFGISRLFEKIHEGVYYLAERPDPPDYGQYPSIYPRGEAQVLPPWIAFDGQRLEFKAYFQETVQERWQSCFQVRVVKITYFLEDGTMKIVEPAIDNSGLEQGVLVRRQRIPLPSPVKNQFYDILDLNIGNQPEIYGRVYKIVDCDKFTRNFLNRMGIPVPDPIEIPNDHYMEKRQTSQFAKQPSRRSDTLGKFLKYDRKILRFYGYWDDSESEHGYIHNLELCYYLADDTMEIRETALPNSGIATRSMFVKKMKVPKFFKGMNPLGSGNPYTVLNVLGESAAQSWYLVDPLNTGNIPVEYYKENDLTIGAQLDIFGRRVVITDLDPFTKEYYRAKYGLDDFKPLKNPGSDSCDYSQEKEIPPYNGFGSYDDSLGNCLSIVPKMPRVDFVRFHEFDKQGLDNRVLRFRAKMISHIPDNSLRHFVIRVFLMDDTISIFEMAPRNTGFQSRLFQKKMRVMLPGQDIYTNVKPKYYEPSHFYVGARVNLCDTHFQITLADEYALRYMEINCDKFPKANIKLIMDKLREGLKPFYKDFLVEFSPKESGCEPVLEYRRFREAMCRYLGDNIVEHEMITVARHYTWNKKEERYSREYIRRLMHTEISRLLWIELDRLEEDVHHWDRARTGFLPRDELYTILRGCRIPVDPELLKAMLDHLHKNEQGLIDYNDMLRFMNTKINPVTPMVPISIKNALWWASEKEPDYGAGLDWCAFLRDLDIKEDDPAPQSLNFVPTEN